MPIVNKANYVSCPSCGKWMHKLPLASYEEPFCSDAVLYGDMKGNRAHICQECYEGADAQPMQADQNEESKRKVADQAKPFDTPVTRAKLDKAVSEDEIQQFIEDFNSEGWMKLDGSYGSQQFGPALQKFISRRISHS